MLLVAVVSHLHLKSIDFFHFLVCVTYIFIYQSTKWRIDFSRYFNWPKVSIFLKLMEKENNSENNNTVEAWELNPKKDGCCLNCTCKCHEKARNNKVTFCDTPNEIASASPAPPSEPASTGTTEIVVLSDSPLGIWPVKRSARYVRRLVFFGCSPHCLLV